MKLMFYTLVFLFFGFLTTSIYADSYVLTGEDASKRIENTQVIRYNDRSPLPNYIQFKVGYYLPKQNFNAWTAQFFRESGSNTTFQYVNQVNDQIGYTHDVYQQMIYGIPVQFGVIKTHARGNDIYSISGEMYPATVNVSIAAISEQAALNKALTFIGAQKYMWQDADQEKHFKWEQENPDTTYFPTGSLTYIYKDNEPSNLMRLAYKFDVYAEIPLSRRYIWVDAVTGEILYENNILCHANATGTAQTQYSGTQTITTDKVNNNQYRLRETGRGAGNTAVQTFNMKKGTNYGNSVDFTDTDNNWNNVNANKDQYATDAHWGQEMTVDYFWLKHNRNSINGNGMAVKGYVHYSTNYLNAFWDGSRMTYGDGSQGYNPLTSIDIAAHEITHGVTQYTAGLNYQNQSGALNESFSDIFGNSIEYFAKPGGASWQVGEGLGGAAFRSMSNPKSFGDPNCYQGQYWYTGTGDNGGVHQNSGVQNFWYYLMVQGGAATNDLGNAYNVTGIGWTSASEIAYRNLAHYLSANSTYADARFYAIQSAEDLFGPCSQEYVTTTNAWYAVGVGSAYSGSAVNASFAGTQTTWCSVPHQVDFANTGSSGSGITYLWDFGDGTTSTNQNPSHTYTSFGQYDVTLTVTSTSCGSDVETITNFINIDPNNDCYSCDTLNLPPPGTLTVYGTQQGGYITGWNGYHDKCITNKFTNFTPYSQVTGAFIYFYYLYDGGNNAQVEINIWDNTGTGGNPGNIIGTETISLLNLANILNGHGILYIDYPSPITVTPEYYLGVRMLGFGATDSLAIVSNKDGDSPVDMVWIQESNNTWGSFSSQWGGTSLDCYISPIMTETPPQAIITPSALTICTGSSIHFDGTGSLNVGSYSWNFPNGSVTNSTDGEIDVSYATPGTYKAYLHVVGGCSGVDVDSVTITVTNGPNINIAASQTTICEGESVTLVASGGSNYSWDNGLGNGSTKTVSPTSTTTYTVSSSVGGCTSVKTIQITVNSIPDVIINASQTSICEGESVTLEASGASTYSWSNGLGNGANKTVTPTQTTSYTVTGTTGSCFDTETIQILVNPTPIVSITASQAVICAGDDVTLEASGASIYTWDNGLGGGFSHVVSPTSTTTYVVTGTMGGCSATASIEITVVPAIDVNIAASQTTICPGDDVTLTASGASNYAWADGLGTGSSIVVTPTQTTTYEVTGTSGGCVDTETIEIVVAPSIDIQVVASQTTICSGEDVTLTASGASSYSWDNGLGSGAVQVVSPTQTTTYEVTGTSGNCVDTETIEIIVEPGVNLSITASQLTICAGDDVVLTASGAASYSWDNGLGTNSSITVSPTSTTTYSVTGTSGNCSDSETIEIIVVPGVAVSISSSQPAACMGDTITLTASGAGTYTWSNGYGMGTSIQVTPSQTTTYEVTGVAGSCSGSETIEIVVNPLPTVNLSASETSICNNEDVTLMASGADSYVWNNGLGNGSIQIVSPTQTTVYTVYGADNSTGCENSASVTIYVGEGQVVSATASTLSICAGDTVYMNASGANNYSWTPSGDIVETSVDGSNITVVPSQSTDYTVIGSGNCGAGFQTIHITVYDYPNPSITQYGNTLVVNLQIGESAEWFLNGVSIGNGPSINITEDGDYTVIVNNGGSCSSTLSGHFIYDTTSLLEEIANNLKIYPNPTNGKFIVEWSTSIHMKDIIVMDVIGRVIMNLQTDNSTTQSIDLTEFETGVYVLQMITENGAINRKVTKR
ncbi:MAG: M4 family metallopeptidase [Brumimicrobium sp.]|nr:M4 family metallopeptidase [Brumimicrobium sp.]